MNKLIVLAISLVIFTSCEKTELTPEVKYDFEMTGRTNQDINGYYHLKLRNPGSSDNHQTLHRFGAHITNFDSYGLPSQVFWTCDAFWYLQDTIGYTYIEIGNVPTGQSPWSWENFAVTGFGGMTVPIVNGTSNADSQFDSIYCMMAPVWEMKGDTVTIYGEAWFEEGDITIEDSFNIIFE